MKKWLPVLLTATQIFALNAQASEGTMTKTSETVATKNIFNKPDKQVETAFIDDLMSKMTLEEKIGQMNLLSVGFDVTGPIVSQDVDEKIKKGLVGGVFNIFTPVAVRKLQELAVTQSRLKIPLLFGYDVIHGHKTIFPINLGLSCSWDPELVEKTARAAAVEATADGLNWAFSPMVDIARDPRWGRVMEGSGEDPYLGSLLAKATVRGYQGTSYKTPDSLMACVKHFALYGAAEAGRDYNTVDMSLVKMYNDYLPPYKAAVKAGVDSVMTSFNEINGVPATGNKWLMDDLLRKSWGFKGIIATDYTAVSEMIHHGVGDESKVTELSMNAGVDMDMVSELFTKEGSALVKSGKVSPAQIDAACRRILEIKYKLGLFDNPYRFVSDEQSQKQIMSADKLALSKEAAVKSFVLLKNNNQVLPLNPKKKIAFIGPLVKDQRNLIGSWSGAGDWHKSVSVWQALDTKYGAANFLYAKGCNLIDDKALIDKLNANGAELSQDPKSTDQLLKEAVATAEQSDIVVAVLGEACSLSGEAASRSDIGLFQQQVALLNALKSTGKPLVLVLMNGRPLVLHHENAIADSILETWFGGTNAGAAIVDTLFGDANPSGKLTMSFPHNVGQIPIYYNAKNTGRPFDEKEKYRSKYLDVSNTPLFPFGYGLSYTEFEYGPVTLSSSSLKPSETLTVRTTVKNVGKRAGVETMQLYVRDLVGSITRPVKELKGFQKVELQPGEQKTISFKLSPEDLRFYNANLDFVTEPGEFKVFCGPDSANLKEAKFSLLQ
ncbi:MAG TPA: beta-glucosidase BglX [Oculatellaceae cyanobacterium]